MKNWKKVLGDLPVAEPQLRIPADQVKPRSLASMLWQVGEMLDTYYTFRRVGAEYWIWRMPEPPRRTKRAQPPSAQAAKEV